MKRRRGENNRAGMVWYGMIPLTGLVADLHNQMVQLDNTVLFLVLTRSDGYEECIHFQYWICTCTNAFWYDYVHIMCT